jgi:uracil-DNA glycosylase
VSFRLANYWHFGSSWKALDGEFEQGYVVGLERRLSSGPSFYPQPTDIFQAFKSTPLNDVRVVVLGQDPYTKGQATGLAFAVRKDAALTPSLRIIYCELCHDLGLRPATCGDLTSWAEQGVVLLNCALTVGSKARSHSRWALWGTFIDQALQLVQQTNPDAVFCLWGADARAKAELLSNKNHILSASHPGPLSAGGFFGCEPFSKANALLRQTRQAPICWKIPRYAPGTCSASPLC